MEYQVGIQVNCFTLKRPYTHGLARYFLMMNEKLESVGIATIFSYWKKFTRKNKKNIQRK